MKKGALVQIVHHRPNPDLLATPIVVYTEDGFTGAWRREGTMTLGEFLERNDDLGGLAAKDRVVREFTMQGGTYTHRAKKAGDITWRIELPGGPYRGRR